VLEQAPHAEHGNWLPQAQMLAPPSMPPAAAVSNVGMGAGTGGDAALPRMLPLTSTVRSRRRSVTKQLVCSRGLTHSPGLTGASHGHIMLRAVHLITCGTKMCQKRP